MGPRAIGLAFQKRRPFPAPGSRNGFTGEAVDFRYVVAIQFEAGNAVRSAAAADAGI
jgi:hypothetical protein